MAFRFGGGSFVKFPIKPGLCTQNLGTAHVCHGSFSFSIARARASRDITVPIGAPVVSAISR